MMKCKECGNIASYNSYFGAYYCSVCGRYFKPQYEGSTRELIDTLREYGTTKTEGKAGKTCVVPKDLLISAANHLERLKE